MFLILQSNKKDNDLHVFLLSDNFYSKTAVFIGRGILQLLIALDFFFFDNLAKIIVFLPFKRKIPALENSR